MSFINEAEADDQDRPAHGWWKSPHEPVNLAIDAAAGFVVRCLYAKDDARRGLLGKVMPSPIVGSAEFAQALRRLITQHSPLLAARGPSSFAAEDSAARAETALLFHPAIVNDEAAKRAIAGALDVPDRPTIW